VIFTPSSRHDRSLHVRTLWTRRVARVQNSRGEPQSMGRHGIDSRAFSVRAGWANRLRTIACSTRCTMAESSWTVEKMMGQSLDSTYPVPFRVS
jgi:hypothetical protein